jgi:hypothetical protein
MTKNRAIRNTTFISLLPHHVCTPRLLATIQNAFRSFSGLPCYGTHKRIIISLLFLVSAQGYGFTNNWHPYVYLPFLALTVTMYGFIPVSERRLVLFVLILFFVITYVTPDYISLTLRCHLARIRGTGLE